MKNSWDERYDQAEYAYGKEPNEYLAEKLRALEPGSILFPAEGEGRNAVYAAKLGWQVSAFDSSTEGKKKAFQLAEELGVTIGYDSRCNRPEKEFDSIAFVYAHVPPEERMELFRNLSCA